IQCLRLQGTQIIHQIQIDPQVICQVQYDYKQYHYRQHDVVPRLADYYDPSSWQCYKNVRRLGLITPFLGEYCSKRVDGASGVNSPPREKGTAYDWSCHSRDNSQDIS